MTDDLLPGLIQEPGPSWWQKTRAARHARATDRAQRRLDRRQLRRAARDRWARRWAALQPVALAVLACVCFVAAGASTGLLLDAGTRAAGVTLVVGNLCATVGLVVLEWRIRGE